MNLTYNYIKKNLMITSKKINGLKLDMDMEVVGVVPKSLRV